MEFPAHNSEAYFACCTTLYENWISDVFGEKQSLNEHDFVNNAITHGSWMFKSQEIRRRFGHASKNPMTVHTPMTTPQASQKIMEKEKSQKSEEDMEKEKSQKSEEDINKSI